MNLYDIQTFLTIVETRNITKTAESLFITQPTVSRRLSNLEEEVGAKLVRRGKGMKQVELTERGEAFVVVAEHFLSVWEEMNMIRHEEGSTLLTVSSVDTLNSIVLAPIYRHLLRTPESRIKLHIQTHHSNTIYRLVEQRQSDVGFVVFNLNYKNVSVKPIAREKMYLVQPDLPGSLKKKMIHTNELRSHTEVHFRGYINFENWHSQWIDQGIVSPIYVDTYDLLQQMLSVEKTWSIVPASIAERLQEEYGVIISEVSNEIAPPDRIAYCVTHKYMSEATKNAVDLLEEMVESYIGTKTWER